MHFINSHICCSELWMFYLLVNFLITYTSWCIPNLEWVKAVLVYCQVMYSMSQNKGSPKKWILKICCHFLLIKLLWDIEVYKVYYHWPKYHKN